MNRTSKKRAFFVVLGICVVYLSVGLQVTDLFSMRRTSPGHGEPLSPMNLSAGGLHKEESSFANRQDPGEEIPPPIDAVPSPDKAEEAPPTYFPVVSPQSGHSRGSEEPKPSGDRVTTVQAAVSQDRLSLEPSMLITVPVICLALKEGRIDKEGLIFVRKDAYNSGSWKKPFDILRDHDEEGVRALLRNIGNDFLPEILRREGIETRPSVSPEQLMTGKGYTVEKKKLLSLYHRHVAKDYDDLFPFMLPTVGVIKTKEGFELVEAPRSAKPAARLEEEEWLMPNLVNLPLRLAVEKLAAHTSKIKVYGSGVVVEQSPRAFERLRGNCECSIQGRLYSQ